MLSEINNILINDISELNGDELEPDFNFNLEVDINQSIMFINKKIYLKR